MRTERSELGRGILGPRLGLALALAIGLLACASSSEPPPSPSESGVGAAAAMPARAWSEFCERIEQAGLQIYGDDFPGSPRERAEGLRHLARTLGMALQWEVDFADSDFPAFYRHDDDVTTWGGPNVDNTYLRARIRGDATYRLSGNVATISDLIISTRNGDMHQGRTGVAGDLDRSELPIDAEGNFAILVGPDVREGEGIRTMPDVDHLSIRQYFIDWKSESPAEFHVERISPGPAVPVPLELETIEARLDRAARWVETSIPFWNAWLREHAHRLPPNQASPPGRVAGGSSDIFYGGIRFELDEDEALLVELVPPKARYWSFQWYTFGWYEPPDFANRQTSLNLSQARVDEDGRVRLVVSARDPGIQNWLDTAGHREGSLAYRYVWSEDAPAPATKVVPLAELRAQLPASTPHFDESQRRAQIELRRRHVERRFRR